MQNTRDLNSRITSLFSWCVKTKTNLSYKIIRYYIASWSYQTIEFVGHRTWISINVVLTSIIIKVTIKTMFKKKERQKRNSICYFN